MVQAPAQESRVAEQGCFSDTDFSEIENETFQGEKEEHQVLENTTIFSFFLSFLGAILAFLDPDPARYSRSGYFPFFPQEAG